MKKWFNLWYILLWIIISFTFFLLFYSYQNWDIVFEKKFENSNLENTEWILYFSPTYDHERYLDYIDENTENLWIYIYSFIYDPIIDKFDKISKDTDIKIIIENNKFRHNDKDYLQLIERFKNNSNIEIKNDEDLDINFMHAKTFLFDDKFIIQTANLTYSAFFRSSEIFFVWYNKNILKSLKYIFEQDWKWESIDKDKIHPNLLVCNINCRETFENYLSNAKTSIKIFNQSLSDPNITNILNNFDWDLKIILSDNEYNYSNKEIFDNNELQFLEQIYLHAKSVLIDDKYLIVWSTNFTTNSIDNNREINIVIINNDLINDFNKNFSKYWK